MATKNTPGKSNTPGAPDTLDTLALHPHTKEQLARFVSRPSHALLLLGPDGAGKHALTFLAMRQLLQLPAESDLANYPYLKYLEPEKDKTAISIEAVRELQHFAALKLPGNRTLRFIVIPQAHGLTTEAQNALLKLLEEPPQGTHFILAANNQQALLPTIRSRVQQLTVHRPPAADLIHHFTHAGYDAKTIQQAYFMSGGLPGLMHALLHDEEHPLKSAARTARQLLQSTPFERLCKVDELSKKRPEALQVLTVLRHMAQAAIEQTAKQAKTTDEATAKRLKQWHKVLQASYDAEKAYSVSAQAKLTLTNLMLSL